MKKILAIACSAAVLAAVAGCGSGDSPSSGASPSPTASQTSSAAPSAAQTPSSGLPTPSESSAVAEGFPEALVPLHAGSTPTATSFAEDGKLLTASLTASTTAAPEEIVAFYTQHFESQGFAALEGDAVDSTTSKDFARILGAETETANVSVVSRDGKTVYTVGANVLPESAK